MGRAVDTFHPVRAALAAALCVCLRATAFDPAEQVLLADGLYSRGMYEMAAREYANVMTNATVANLDAVLFRLGECQRLTGHGLSAIDVFGQLVARFPQSEFRYRGEFRRAELMVTGGQFPQAVSAFRSLLAGSPPAELRASALYYYGFTQDRLLLTNDAEKAYAELVGSYTNSPFLALACISLGELRERRHADVAGIRALYQQAAAAAPTPRVNAEALFKLGSLGTRSGSHAAAADAFSELLTKHPADERVVSNRLAIAWAFHNAGRFPQALQLAREGGAAVAGEPQAEWFYLRANALRRTDHAAEARATYEDLLRRHAGSPLAPHAAFELATLLFAAGKHAEVVALGAMLSPTNGVSDVSWMLAESHAALKQVDAAAANFARLVETAPADPRAPLAAYRRGAVLEEAGRADEAARAYRDLVARYPTHAMAADALARAAGLALKAGRREEAIADWSALARQHPQYPGLDGILLAQAQAEAHLGRDKDAIATLGTLIASTPKSPLQAQAHYLRGALMEKGGDLQAAAFHYAAAMASKPQAELARTIQLRRVAVLQRQEKPADAAAVLQGLIAGGGSTSLPPAQVEWLVRWQLLQKDHAAAETSAGALLGLAGDDPSRATAWFLAGRARQGRGDMAGARKAYESALARTNAPGREAIEARLHLGECALADKDPAGAATAFARAAEQASTDALLDLRARCYHGLGLAALAREQWNEAARYFMSVAVLFEDPELTPECLARAAAAFGRAGQPAEQQKAVEELKRRYPESSWARQQET